MESKYYRPDDEEFYIGFEYYREEPYTGDMSRCEWTGDTTYRHYNKYSEEFYVKYLDKSDIESCGFKFDFEATRISYIKSIDNDIREGELELRHYNDDRFAQYHKTYGNKRVEIIFSPRGEFPIISLMRRSHFSGKSALNEEDSIKLILFSKLFSEAIFFA